MTIAADNVVTVNAGSSSVKLAVFTKSKHTSEVPRRLDMSVSNIGQPGSRLQVAQPATSTQTEELYIPDHAAAAGAVMERLHHIISPDSVAAVGHRLVHGGPKFIAPTPATNISESDWGLLSRLDPQHTPAARQLITQFAQLYPSVLQVVCFDTAFFHDLPREVKIIPVPKKYYEAGLRRYGFHGLSYVSLLTTFREKAGVTAANGRVILAHLGSGASLAATQSGKPVDTTMGFTPASGIAMSTRSGDLDPTIFGFLHRRENMPVAAFDHMVNYESGLLGVSGVTGDMHSLLDLEKGDKDAAIAIEVFVRDVKKSVGALCATLGGVDSLIFSGGIGEQSAVLRARICQGLEYMGIEINEVANEQNSFLISAAHSRAGVHVIHTDEARVIAEQTIELLHSKLRPSL